MAGLVSYASSDEDDELESVDATVQVRLILLFTVDRKVLTSYTRTRNQKQKMWA